MSCNCDGCGCTLKEKHTPCPECGEPVSNLDNKCSCGWRKEKMTNYPICKRLKCGCYVEIWEDIQRTDYCEEHAKGREK